MHAEEAYIMNMIKAGANGYVLKDSGGQKLVEAVKLVASGKNYYSNDVTVTMINRMINPDKALKGSSNLSKKELEILKHVVDGKTNIEISNIYDLSSRTIETHRRNIMKKMNVKNTAEMVGKALKNGLVK